MQQANEEQKQEHLQSDAANPQVPEEYLDRDAEPASMITLVRGIADLSGGLNMLAMTTNQLPVRALAQLGNQLSRASIALLDMHIRAEAQMAFRDGRNESPAEEIANLWEAIQKLSITVQALDVSTFVKAKREALEGCTPTAPKVVADKTGKRKGKVNE